MNKTKIILTIVYNTNTAVINPTIYLKFLIPFLLLEKAFSWRVAFAYIVALYIYNLVYMINDYIDYTHDIAEKRRKKSFVHLYGDNFILPTLWTLFVIIIGAVLLGWQTIIPMAVVAIILGFIHSYFRGLKPITFLLLRFFRIAMPPILILSTEPVFKNLLLFSLVVFPIYNLKSYIEYAELKKFNPKLGILISIVASGIFTYLCKPNTEQFIQYAVLFVLILCGVKILSRALTPIALNLFENLLKSLSYEDIEKKVGELLTLTIYLLLLGVVVWF